MPGFDVIPTIWQDHFNTSMDRLAKEHRALNDHTLEIERDGNVLKVARAVLVNNRPKDPETALVFSMKGGLPKYSPWIRDGGALDARIDALREDD